MSKINAWINAARLRTLPLAFAGIFLGSFIAYAEGGFNWDIFFFALITTLLLQVLSNFANDYGDYTHGTDNNERVGPMRTVQSGKISPKQMKTAIYITGLASFSSGIYLLKIAFKDDFSLRFFIFLILGIAAIAAAIKYTVGKSNYGYKGFGDVIVFLFFGLVSVIGTYFLFTNQFSWAVLLPASSIGFLSSGVLNLNNMRDVENDAKSGKITLVVKMGFEKSKFYHTALIAAGITCAYLFALVSKSWSAAALILIPDAFLAYHWYKVFKTENPQLLDPELKNLALLTLFLSFILGIGLIF